MKSTIMLKVSSFRNIIKLPVYFVEFSPVWMEIIVLLVTVASSMFQNISDYFVTKWCTTWHSFIELSTPFLFSFLCRMLILFFCLCMQQKADSASIHHQPRNCKYCTVSYFGNLYVLLPHLLPNLYIIRKTGKAKRPLPTNEI